MEDVFAGLEQSNEYIEVTPQGVPYNDKVALIDADTIAYIAAVQSEEVIELLPESFYQPEEWADITSSPYFNEEDGIVKHTNLQLGMEIAVAKINKIVDGTGCRNIKLFFSSSSSEGFRKIIYSEYKANRKKLDIPAGLTEIKKELAKHYPSELCLFVEADDAVVYHKKQDPENTILVAVDKDVLYSVPGKHFNYYESRRYEVNYDMKFVEVKAEEATWWPIIQAIAGDTSDNIPGINKVGPKKILKAIVDKFGTKEDSENVASIKVKTAYEVLPYVSKYGIPHDEKLQFLIDMFGDEEEAMMNYHLVNLHSIDTIEEDDYMLKPDLREFIKLKISKESK